MLCYTFSAVLSNSSNFSFILQINKMRLVLQKPFSSLAASLICKGLTHAYIVCFLGKLKNFLLISCIVFIVFIVTMLGMSLGMKRCSREDRLNMCSVSLKCINDTCQSKYISFIRFFFCTNICFM